MKSSIRRNNCSSLDNFQFGWISDPSISHSIAMETLSTPHLLVLNTTTNVHHLPDDDPLEMTPEAVEMFLERYFLNLKKIHFQSFHFFSKRLQSNCSDLWRRFLHRQNISSNFRVKTINSRYVEGQPSKILMPK